MSPAPDDATPVEPRGQHVRVLDRLRAYGAISTELSRRFAASLGLHPTDASALIEILEAEERGTALSPSRLSERIGLTSGATSSLLNRLEENGHIVRSRVHADRRVVTLHSTSEVQQVADEFFDPLTLRLGTLLSSYPDGLLAQVETLLTELHSIAEAYVEDLSS